MTIRKSRIKLRKFNGGNSYKRIKKLLKEKYNYKTTKEEIEKVWEAELENKINQLFEKGEASLSDKIGSLVVYKLPITELSDFVKAKVVKPNKEGERVNFKRVGFYYFIGFEKNEKISDKVKFIPSEKMKLRLTEILNTTEKEYKPALLKYYKSYKPIKI